MALFDIGHWLGKSVSEVLELSVEELKGWAAHMRLRHGK